MCLATSTFTDINIKIVFKDTYVTLHLTRKSPFAKESTNLLRWLGLLKWHSRRPGNASAWATALLKRHQNCGLHLTPRKCGSDLLHLRVLSGKTSPLGSCLPTWEHFSSFTQPLCLISSLLVFSISLPSGSSFLLASHLELWFSFIRMSIYFLHVNYPLLLPSSWHCLVQLLPAPGFVLHQVGGKDCSQQLQLYLPPCETTHLQLHSLLLVSGRSES